MTRFTITAFYDSREYADEAARMLQQAGVPASDVTVSPQSVTAASDHTAMGFWATLEEMFGGADDHGTYSEGLRRGGIMVVAHVDDAKVREAVRILEQHGSVDLAERETAWRQDRWTGGSTLTRGVADAGAAPLGSMTPAPEPSSVAAIGATRRTSSEAGVVPIAAGTEDMIQVVEETLNVGKRAVSRGKVRIHAYLVEAPVTETVTLRDETVIVDRHAVDRPLAAADLGVDAFQDRTIEMEEIDEEAVVAKTVRVVEEIGIRKDVKDEVRTITGTVRSTKVDVDDTRMAAARPGAVGGSGVAQDMEVVGSDGQHVGVIDHVDGPVIKLKRLDSPLAGSHHLIPTDWIQSVDTRVMPRAAAADVKSRWTAA